MLASRGRVAAWTPGRRFAWTALVALLVALLLVAMAPVAAAQSSPQVEAGQQVFQGKCVSCHSIGQGDKAGPDLAGVTERRELEWLQRWILAPDRVLADNDPIATELLGKYQVAMPNMGLSEADVAAVIAFLTAAARGEVDVQAASLPAGDTAAGKNLFTGNARFQNGGPACMSCHAIAGMANPGGGALGPDLTQAHARLGDGMIAWPETVLPMRAIYGDKPLTDQEKGHLLAFFRSASVAQRPTSTIVQLAGVAVAGAAVLMGLAHLLWRGRLRGVRRPLVGR